MLRLLPSFVAVISCLLCLNREIFGRSNELTPNIIHGHRVDSGVAEHFSTLQQHSSDSKARMVASLLETDANSKEALDYVLLYPCKVCQRVMKRLAETGSESDEGLCPEIAPSYLSGKPQQECIQYVDGRCITWDAFPPPGKADDNVFGFIMNPFDPPFGVALLQEMLTSSLRMTTKGLSSLAGYSGNGLRANSGNKHAAAPDAKKDGKRPDKLCKQVVKQIRETPQYKLLKTKGCTMEDKPGFISFAPKCPWQAACNCIRNPDMAPICGGQLVGNGGDVDVKLCLRVGPELPEEIKRAKRAEQQASDPQALREITAEKMKESKKACLKTVGSKFC